MRDEGVAIGRLVRRAEEEDGNMSPSSANRWIVSFEGEEHEEEITEKYIGRLVDSNESDSLSTQSRKPAPIKSSSRDMGKNKSNAVPQQKAARAGGNRKTKHLSPAASAADSDRPSTRFTTRSSKAEKILYTGIKDKKVPKGKKSKKGGPNETVVKVKMLTGTLYLYRGENPRAEFIRTV